MAAKTLTLKELSDLIEATLVGDPEHQITGVETLESAGPEDASFLANSRYRAAMQLSKAGVICVDRNTPLEEGKNYLISNDPSGAFQRIATHLLITPLNTTGFTGIHPTAVIHPDARIGLHVQIGPYAVIDQGVIIGDHTRIASHVSISAHVTIGTHCLIHPHVTIREGSVIGHRVILQPGAVIGSCGFGYLTDAKGNHSKLDQLGNVTLEDDVEVGANTTIDRARFKTTRISAGSKVDNLVQIGHNVTLGHNNIVVSQTGISGSVKTGSNVIFGGQAGIVGHLEITDRVMIAARGGVSKSITKAGKYAGAPVMSVAEYNRQQVYLRNIADYVKQVESLEKRLKQLESTLSAVGTLTS